jgi:16S rRNA (guanine527-N7)-methyltransferase
LAEPRPKRITFLKEAIQKVGLTQTSVFEHKVVSRSFTKPVPGYITRAVETMDKTVLRTSGSLTLGGELIFMKGPHADQELRDCLKRFGQHFSLKADIKYRLPKSTHERRLIVLEKTSEWAKTPH